MSEWRTIDSAPKDGKPCLIVGGSVEEGDWGDKKRSRRLRKSSVVGVRIRDGYWVIAEYDMGCGSVGYYDPTHWQPLPEPPHGD